MSRLKRKIGLNISSLTNYLKVLLKPYSINFLSCTLTLLGMQLSDDVEKGEKKRGPAQRWHVSYLFSKIIIITPNLYHTHRMEQKLNQYRSLDLP